MLYQYHVDFDPVIESKRLRVALFNQHNKLFDNVKAFDGMTLYSLTKLPNDVIMNFRTTYLLFMHSLIN